MQATKRKSVNEKPKIMNGLTGPFKRENRAFQAASGGPQPVEAQTARTRTKRSDQWTLSGDAGVWQAVADVLSQLILIIDSDGKIREANVQHADAVASITGALIESRGQQLVPRVEKA